eukprot:2520774-Prymnesium_polylepis.1
MFDGARRIEGQTGRRASGKAADPGLAVKANSHLHRQAYSPAAKVTAGVSQDCRNSHAQCPADHVCPLTSAGAAVTGHIDADLHDARSAA